MKNILTNWKTTSAGILSIIGAGYVIYNGHGSQESVMGGITGILAGLGLFFAKDGNVTGGTKQQPGVREIVPPETVAKNVEVVPMPEKK